MGVCYQTQSEEKTDQSLRPLPGSESKGLLA